MPVRWVTHPLGLQPLTIHIRDECYPRRNSASPKNTTLMLKIAETVNFRATANLRRLLVP